MTIKIDKELALKCLKIIDQGLVAGLGIPEPGKFCVEAAINYALGRPHGDDPGCVAQSLRRLKIRLNDANWSSNAARAKGLTRLALAQLGSAGHLDEIEFGKRCARLAIQTCVPQALRAVAPLFKGEQKERLLAAADLCERDPTREHAQEARSAAAAYAAAYAVAAYASADAAAYAVAAAYAAYASAAAAAYAADASASDASAAYAADASAAYAAYAADKSLASFAEGVVQILIELKAPGCQWLHLCGEVAA
jgi:hypothetical protein